MPSERGMKGRWMANPEDPEQLEIFDSLSFRLVMDGVYASIHLNDLDPKKGITREQAQKNLEKWFPSGQVILDDPEA